MKLVDNIQERFTARLVYGDMVEQDGLIVIPAIRVMGGGGGGGGTDPEHGDPRFQNPGDRRKSVCPSCKSITAWQRRIVKEENV